MFVCSRCGSSYNARHIGVEHCPRCRLRDKVDAPLAFKAFDLSSLEVSPPQARDQIESSGSGSSTKTSAAMPSSVT
jgi:hypothetical protein